MSDHPRTDAFENSCATIVALRYKKLKGEKANIMEVEFVLALEHARILERELRALRPEGREQVIEECARICDLAEASLREEGKSHHERDWTVTGDELYQQAAASRHLAEEIRSLKQSSPQEGSGNG